MVIERLSNSLMLIISSLFAGSRATFTSTVHIFRVAWVWKSYCYVISGFVKQGGGAHLTKPGWSKPHTHSNPTYYYY